MALMSPLQSVFWNTEENRNDMEVINGAAKFKGCIFLYGGVYNQLNRNNAVHYNFLWIAVICVTTIWLVLWYNNNNLYLLPLAIGITVILQ